MRKKSLGTCLFVLEGRLTVDGESLDRRDAIAISDVEKVGLRANSEASVLVIEFPMQ